MILAFGIGEALGGRIIPDRGCVSVARAEPLQSKSPRQPRMLR